MMFGVLGACGCLQRRGLGVALAGVRVWSADVDDGVVPEYAAPAVHDDVALLAAAIAVITLVCLLEKEFAEAWF